MKTHVTVSILLICATLAATAGVVSLLFVAMTPTHRRIPERVIPKVLAPAIEPKRNYVVNIIGYGSARPRVKVSITPEVSGKVTEKAANYLSGKYVTAGQVLFRIEKTDYELALAAAARKIELLDARLRGLDQEEANLAESEKLESARVELAKKQHDRAVKLLERGAGTENEVDTAREALLARRQQHQNILNQKALIAPQREQIKAETRIAHVEKDQAKIALKRTTVTSPVTGRVLSCEVEVGEQAQAGVACGELYGSDIMEIPVSVPAGELRWIDADLLEACKHGTVEDRPRRHIQADVQWDEPGTERHFVWRGCVERVEAGLEAQTRTATLVVRVRNSPASSSKPAAGPARSPGADRPEAEAPQTCRPGEIPLDRNMFCKVVIRGKTQPQVYVIPRTAIQPDKTVFLVNDGRLSRRRITVARFANQEALILPGGGIEEGDRVVLSYVPKPVLGMQVEAMEEVPAETGAATRPAGAGPGTQEQARELSSS